MLEKYLLNSSEIDCFSDISFSFTRIEVGKFDDFGDFPGSIVRSSSHVFRELLVFFKFVCVIIFFRSCFKFCYFVRKDFVFVFHGFIAIYIM